METSVNQLVSKCGFAVSHLSGDALIARLVRVRKEKGISQAVLAWRMGIDPANLCRYEKGLTRPSIDMVFLWCDALCYSLRVLPKKFIEF